MWRDAGKGGFYCISGRFPEYAITIAPVQNDDEQIPGKMLLPFRGEMGNCNKK